MMARPPKPPGPGRGRRKGAGFGAIGDGVARLRMVSVRLSDDELAAVQAAATAAGMRPSVWLWHLMADAGAFKAK